jgi:ferredoxin
VLVKIRLDSAVCDGFGTCATDAPNVFSLDEWGYAALKSADGAVAAEDEGPAQRAILDCPVHAIHLVED